MHVHGSTNRGGCRSANHVAAPTAAVNTVPITSNGRTARSGDHWNRFTSATNRTQIAQWAAPMNTAVRYLARCATTVVISPTIESNGPVMRTVRTSAPRISPNAVRQINRSAINSRTVPVT